MDYGIKGLGRGDSSKINEVEDDMTSLQKYLDHLADVRENGYLNQQVYASAEQGLRKNDMGELMSKRDAIIDDEISKGNNMSMQNPYDDLSQVAADITPGGMSVGNPAKGPNMSVGSPATTVQPDTPTPLPQPSAPSQGKDPLSLYRELLSSKQPKQDDGELRQLQEDADYNREVALALQGFNQMAQGVAGGFGAKIGDGSSVVKSLMGMADQGVKDYKQRQQDTMEKMAMDKAEAFSNPNSPLAMMMKEHVVTAFKVNPDSVRDMNASQIQSAFPMLNAEREYERLREKARLDAINKQIDRDMSQRNYELRAGDSKRRLFDSATTNTLKYHPNFKKYDESVKAFDNVKALLKNVDTGNSRALAALGPQLARALGEVGVLTDMDVTRYLSSPEYVEAFKDWASKRFEGKMNPKAVKELNENAMTILKIAREKMNSVKQVALQSAKTRLKGTQWDNKYSDEEIMEYLGQGGYTSEPSPAKELRRRDPKTGKIAIYDENKKFLRWE